MTEAIYKKILVPIDGSDAAMRAVESASRLAAALGSDMFLLHVVHDGSNYAIPPGLEELAHMERMARSEDHFLLSVTEQIMDRATALARERGVSALSEAVKYGQPSTTIVAYAKECDIDLIVMGRHGTGFISELLLGGVAQRVMHLSDRACLTVK